MEDTMGEYRNISKGCRDRRKSGFTGLARNKWNDNSDFICYVNLRQKYENPPYQVDMEDTFMNNWESGLLTQLRTHLETL